MSYRGWEVIYKDGSSFREDSMEWRDIKKSNIQSLTLWFDDRSWSLSNKQGYLQKKTGSMVPGFSESFRVEARSIGYYDGPSKVWYTVNENTGIMKIQVEG